MKILNKEDYQTATMEMLRTSIHDDAKFCRDFMIEHTEEFEQESIVEVLAVQHEVIGEISDCLVRVNNGDCGIDEMIMIYSMNAKKMKDLRFEIIELLEEARSNKKSEDLEDMDKIAKEAWDMTMNK